MNKQFKDMTLAELSYSQGVIQGYVLAAVKEARAGGSTWAGIASSLGVTTSEAHRRYSWVDKIPSTSQTPDTTP